MEASAWQGERAAGRGSKTGTEGNRKQAKTEKKGGGKTEARDKSAHPIQNENSALIRSPISGMITIDPSVEMVVLTQDEKPFDRNHVANRQTRMVKRGREPLIEWR